MEITLVPRRLCSSRGVRPWMFGVANFGADLLHCFGHPSRFGDRNNVVVDSMKDPFQGLGLPAPGVGIRPRRIREFDPPDRTSLVQRALELEECRGFAF